MNRLVNRQTPQGTRRGAAGICPRFIPAKEDRRVCADILQRANRDIAPSQCPEYVERDRRTETLEMNPPP